MPSFLPQPTSPGPTTILATRYLRKASQQGVSPFQKAAYEQLAKLHESKDFAGGELEGITRNADDPMAVLHKMGQDVLPVLVDAL